MKPTRTPQDDEPVDHGAPTEGEADAGHAVEADLVPPEERFWQRYSPHFEFPLSGVSTVLLHLLMIFTIVLVMGMRSCTSHSTHPVEIDSLDIDEGGHGDGDQDENSDANKKVEVTAPQVKPPVTAPTPTPTPVVTAPKDFEVDPNAQRTEQQSSDAAADLDSALQQALGRARGDGLPGQGGAGGDKKGVANARILRWVIELEFADPNEYIRQLHFMNTEIGLAKPGDARSVFIIKDLTARPAKPELVSVSSVQRIFWRDTNESNVVGVCQALGVEPPKAGQKMIFYAFMPREMENELVTKELDFAKKRKIATKESEIAETVFKVEIFGTKPVITVKSVKPKTSEKK